MGGVGVRAATCSFIFKLWGMGKSWNELSGSSRNKKSHKKVDDQVMVFSSIKIFDSEDAAIASAVY